MKEEQCLSSLLSAYIELNKSSSCRPGDKSSELARSLEFLHRQIKKCVSLTPPEVAIKPLIDAYVAIVRRDVESLGESHHMMNETKRFLKAIISLQLKRIEL